MAIRLNRLYLVVPSGARLFRWPQSSRQLQTWPAGSSHFHTAPGGLLVHHHPHTPTQTAHFCVPLSNYSLGQPAYPVASRIHQCLRRSYSEGESQGSKASSSNSGGSSTTAAPESGASDKALSSAQRVRIILREYGTVAVVFHLSMSLCTLGVCYLLVSK